MNKQDLENFERQERQEATQELRKMLKVGDTVYTILRDVSRSGTQRAISCVVVIDNDLKCIDHLVAKALGWKLSNRHEGIAVRGCGMDMGFHLVYSLSYTLFDEGFLCIGKGCPSNDHFNGDSDYTPHTHDSGGYALIQRWI